MLSARCYSLAEPLFNGIIPGWRTCQAGALSPLMTGDQRREPHGNQLAGPRLMVVAFVDHDELLLVLHSDGKHHPTAGLQLFEQPLRNLPGRRGQQDLVERGMLHPAPRAIADAQLDVVATGGAQPAFPLLGQLLDDFDRENLLRQLREDRRLIAKPGADLEDLVVLLDREQVCHKRDDEWLRDRFAIADRQRQILVGPFLQLDRNEVMARNHGHRLHDAVTQTVVADFVHAQTDMDGDDHHHRLSAFHKVQLVRV